MVDLIRTGKYGVLNSQKLLNATSNNINNVNTEGYIRKETQTYTSCVDWGVGDTYTRRVYNQYIQKTLYSDTSSVNYYQSYSEALSSADNIMSNSEMSLGNAASNVFDALATAAASPTSAANREACKSSMELLLNRYETTATALVDSISDINEKVDDSVDSINDYNYQICKLNGQIRALQLSDTEVDTEVYQQMLDERDRLIGKLSEEVAINVQEAQDGTYEVYMSSGMLLCNGDNYAALQSKDAPLTSNNKQIYISYKSIDGNLKDKSYVQLKNSDLGGKIQGYLDSATAIRQNLREIGKLEISLADALNEQNKAGFTLEDIAGSDLFNIKDVYAKSSNADYSMLCVFKDGEGSKVQAYDFKVDFHDGNLHVYKVEGDTQATDITSQVTAGTDANGNLTLDLEDYGVSLNFNTSQANLASDKTSFYAEPTLFAANSITSNITKAEDFAFASAVRTYTSSNNYGNATISLESISHTGSNYGVSINETTRQPEFNQGAATRVTIAENGDYLIYDKDDNLIGKAASESNGKNVFANAVTYDAATASFTTTPLADQGYEISISGTVRQGDTFNIEINSGGQADNSNGVTLANIRNQNITRTTGSSKVTTSTEAFSNVVSKLGSEVASVNSNLEASTAKYEQTNTLYQSDSGVSLDEEAANLLMYQQTYQACAKIIEASNTIFTSLINAM